jgi:hypothetical protein
VEREREENGDEIKIMEELGVGRRELKEEEKKGSRMNHT